MALLLECCQKCFMHKQSLHQQSDFYDHFAKLSEKVANRCSLQIIKNPKRSAKNASSLFFSYPKVMRQFYSQEKQQPSQFPRIGSFELYFKDICLYSKLSEKDFPDCNFICNLSLVMEKMDSVEPIQTMLKKHGCESIYELFKNVLLKTKLGTSHPYNLKETFQYKQMYEALNPGKKTALNPNLPRALERNLKRSFLKSKYDSKVKSQTSFKYRDNTKITIQEQADQRIETEKFHGSGSINPQMLFRNSMTQKSRNDEGFLAADRSDLKSATMIDSKTSLQMPEKQLTVFKRTRNQHQSNQYGNLSKRSDIVSQLAATEFKEIKEANFEYLTKKVDLNSEKASSSSSFSLEMLDQSCSTSSTESLPPITVIEPEVVVKKRKKSHGSCKQSQKHSYKQQAFVPPMQEPFQPNNELLPVIPVGDSRFKSCQKRFSSTLIQQQGQQACEKFNKSLKESKKRSSQKTNQPLGLDSKATEQVGKNLEEKPMNLKGQAYQSSKMTLHLKKNRNQSITSLGNTKENGNAQEKLRKKIENARKQKIINPSKFQRNSEQVRQVGKQSQSPYLSSIQRSYKTKEKSISVNGGLKSGKTSPFATPAKSKFNENVKTTSSPSFLTKKEPLKQSKILKQQDMNSKQECISTQKSQRQESIPKVEESNISVEKESELQENVFKCSENQHQANIFPKEEIDPLGVEKDEKVQVLEAEVCQKDGDENKIRVKSQKKSTINQQSKPKNLNVQFLIDLFKNWSSKQTLSSLDTNCSLSSNLSLSNSLADIIKQFYPSPFLVFDVKHKKKLEKFFKSIRDKNFEEEGEFESETKKQKKHLFSEGDLCQVVAYSEGKQPVLFRRVIDLTGELDNMQFFLTGKNEEEQKFMEYSKIRKSFSHLYFWFLREDYQLFGSTVKFSPQKQIEKEEQPQKEEIETNKQLSRRKKVSQKSRKHPFRSHFDLFKPESSQFCFEFKVGGKIGKEYHLFANYSNSDQTHVPQDRESCISMEKEEEVKILIWKANEEGETEELVGEIQKRKNFFFELYLEPGNFLCKFIKCRGEFSKDSEVEFSLYSNSESISFHSEFEE